MNSVNVLAIRVLIEAILADSMCKALEPRALRGLNHVALQQPVHFVVALALKIVEKALFVLLV